MFFSTVLCKSLFVIFCHNALYRDAMDNRLLALTVNMNHLDAIVLRLTQLDLHWSFNNQAITIDEYAANRCRPALHLEVDTAETACRNCRTKAHSSRDRLLQHQAITGTTRDQTAGEAVAGIASTGGKQLVRQPVMAQQFRRTRREHR